MLRTVNMTTELAALLGELADAGERENLKASGVRQYRTVPGIKLVQSACLAQDIQSGAQIEVVGIAQNDLRLHLLAEFGEMYTLHTANRTDGHEDRCLYLAVVGGNYTGTGLTGIVAMLYFKFHFFSSSGIVKSSGLSTISFVRANFHTSCTFST